MIDGTLVDEALRPTSLRAPMDFWDAPLVPVALAATIGILVDRTYSIPLPVSFVGVLAGMLAWVLHGSGPRRLHSLLYLWVSIAFFGSAHHHVYVGAIADDDVSHFANREPRPARLKGHVHSQPVFLKESTDDPLRSFPRNASTRFVMRVTQAQDLSQRHWLSASGLVQVAVVGRVSLVGVGDLVELPGRLLLPEEPANPGAFDYASYVRDQQITALLAVQSAEEVVLCERSTPTSLGGWLAVLRAWAQDVLSQALPTPQAEIASALLLGESSGMGSAEWEKYQRSGVVHVLAISGQHLVVLAGMLTFLARLTPLRRRQSIPLIAALLFAYALLTGGRPPVMRAAWMVLAYTGSVLLQRPAHSANTFALGWLGVAFVNPTDLFAAGCQLSFLAVAVLALGIRHWEVDPPDPLQRLVDASRAWYTLLFLRLVRAVVWAYAINAIVWCAVAPLVAGHYHMVSPIAILLGPPVVVLSCLALGAGFLMLFFTPLLPPLAWLCAELVTWALAGCDGLVSAGNRLPGAYFYVAELPKWWLWVFYGLLCLSLTTKAIARNWRLALSAAVLWLLLAIGLQLWPRGSGELRCTFVAVGHGGCTVLETPDGRVLVYDAGNITGPDVTRLHIAPFLWRRGIRRIDELFLSHADLDHFNGLPALLERFRVSRITCTPTFADRDLAAVRHTLAVSERSGVPIRIVHAGHAWQVGRLSFEVLHPPAEGPRGSENARSLVLHVRDGDFSILLTGDLEDAGLERVLSFPPRKIDVLMAPHHGGKKANTPELARWADPKVVVSCQGPPRFGVSPSRPYDERRCRFLGTWPDGAVTVRRDEASWRVETFQTKQSFVVRVP